MSVFFKKWLPVLFLTLFVVILYGQFLWNPLIFDDIYLFLLDGKGNQPVSGYHFSWGAIRSLPYATLAWTKSWFGLDLIYFRVGNLLLHTAVVLSLYTLVYILVKTLHPVRDENAVSHKLLAFCAALLFAVHPIATYAVGYLVQRTIIMATLFSLWAMLAYVYGSLQNRPWIMGLSVPFYYLAVFSKEHAVMLPAVLVALTFLLHENGFLQLKRRWILFMVLATIAIWVILNRKNYIGTVYEVNVKEMTDATTVSYSLSFITQAWLFFKYIFLWVFPNPVWMSIDMREPFAASLLSPYGAAVLALMAWIGAGVWLLFQRGRRGLAGFAMLYPSLMFATELASVHFQEIFVLYRSYLWAPGTFCALPLLLSKLNPRTLMLSMIMVTVVAFTISMERLATLSHPFLVWDDAEKLVHDRNYLPGSERIYYNRGTELIKLEKYDQAISDLQLAIQLQSNYSEAYNNLGSAYFHLQDWPRALQAYDQAIRIEYEHHDDVRGVSIFGRAMALEKLGKFDQAMADYKVSCLLAHRGCEKHLPSK